MNINEFSKSETVKQQLEELEEKTVRVAKLLEGFGLRIPAMIETLDLISKDMQTEEFKKMLTKLYNSISKLESNQETLSNQVNNMQTSINTYLKKTEEETKKILDTYAKKSSLGKTINWYIICAFIVLSFICGKTILKTQNNINIVNNRMLEIHKILNQEEKYWYDKNSQRLYLRDKEKTNSKEIKK